MLQAVSTVATVATLLRTVPFMSQTTRAPDVCCHSMSVLPLRLKSPVPRMLHDWLTVGRFTTLLRTVPFISQISRAPDVFWQMSVLPSPLKSPEPAILHEDKQSGLPNANSMDFMIDIEIISTDRAGHALVSARAVHPLAKPHIGGIVS